MCNQQSLYIPEQRNLVSAIHLTFQFCLCCNLFLFIDSLSTLFMQFKLIDYLIRSFNYQSCCCRCCRCCCRCGCCCCCYGIQACLYKFPTMWVWIFDLLINIEFCMREIIYRYIYVCIYISFFTTFLRLHNLHVTWKSKHDNNYALKRM